MTRAEALKTAVDHVNKLSTNVRGYQDGANVPDKVAAVERLARFLVESSEDIVATTHDGVRYELPHAVEL